MSSNELHVISPESVADALRSGELASVLAGLSSLAGGTHTVQTDPVRSVRSSQMCSNTVPVRYRTKQVGSVHFTSNGGDSEAIKTAARAAASLIEHAVDREMAVTDLAEEMIASYEELNMLYALLPNIATRVHAGEVGQALVEETRRTLRCERVSLLVLDDSRTTLRVLASHGLPPKVRDISIPIAGSITEKALTGENGLIVSDHALRLDLLELSRGEYEGNAFAVVRVPLEARGEPVGVLTATERIGDAEFTARDQKLLEGLAAMGASALLSCRLHGAINRQMISTIRALASAIDAKDQYTHAHSARVAQLAVATARSMGALDDDTCREVELAGLLHDIGKIGISDSILCKAGRLTPQEFKTVQKHAEIGAGIVKNVEGLERVAEAICHHHERYDGLGYPSGLSGQMIPIMSRLISVADVFDCMTSDRPYRKAIEMDRALAEIKKARGTQLDPAVVEAFLNIVVDETASMASGTGVPQTAGAV